ncbi:hypothetical protein KR222_002350 [Zaprionus bogoriensis]|nr:hypothetical protein KR222_002350 [Zaprionus bogoriensis]
MNYKLDRLIPNQTPTLVRMSRDLAWDLANLDENGEATMVKLAPPTLQHLVPPKDFECPLGFAEDARFARKYASKRRTPPRPLQLEECKKQKLQPMQSQESKSHAGGMSQALELGSASRDAVVTATDPEPPVCAPHSQDELQLKYDELKANCDRLSAENAALKQSLGKLETQLQASKTQATPCNASPATTGMSKPQLYRGIQKYLGPTMAALVRMEMFGGGERAWQNDERDFAKELLQLGEHVYAHCCDEWRFRLPSLRMARSWLHETNTADDEEQDL